MMPRWPIEKEISVLCRCITIVVTVRKWIFTFRISIFSTLPTHSKHQPLVRIFFLFFKSYRKYGNEQSIVERLCRWWYILFRFKWNRLLWTEWVHNSSWPCGTWRTSNYVRIEIFANLLHWFCLIRQIYRYTYHNGGTTCNCGHQVNTDRNVLFDTSNHKTCIWSS